MSDRNELIIGIDSSTSACKTVIYDTQGSCVSEGKSSLSISQPLPGWHEQSAELWWRALKISMRHALKSVDASRLKGLAIAHQRESFVPVDLHGVPLRAGILWMDERAAGELVSLEKIVGREEFHALTGKPLSGNLTYTKIAWLRSHEPDVFDQTAYFLDVHAYLVHQLTGHYFTSWGSADPTGLFDMAQKEWSPRLLGVLGIDPTKMPPAAAPGELLGYVNRAAARETGLPEGLPVFAGLGDGQAGGVGANICQSGTAYLVLGTSVITGSYSSEYVTKPAFRTMFGGVRGSYLLETVLLGGTYTIDWLMHTLFRKTGSAALRYRQELEAGLSDLPAGSEGLMLVPYWNSVMNPYWDASASGIVVGWRGSHTPTHLYRALLEGIAFELRLHFDGVEAALGSSIDRLIAMGGGSRSDAWCQMISDVTAKPLQRSAVHETSALGSAILAAAGAGLFPSIVEAARAMAAWQNKVFTPDPRNQRIYSTLYEDIYQHIYPQLRGLLKNLSSLQK